MYKMRFIKSGLAVFFLCSIAQTMVAQPAFAAAVHVPAGEWVVGPISANSGNGQKFCSMKNNYQTGQSLVFASDNMGSNSIALDFHKDIFQAGKQYDVKAHAGSVTRNVDALAATKQVIVMQTGIDTELYSELATKHNVTFTVDKKSYGFELDVSAADALAALDHCSESLQTGPAFAETKFPLGKVHEESLKQLTAAADEIPAIPDDLPAPKKHHRHAKTQPVQAEEQPQIQVVEATPTPAQVDTVRDDMKAEIAAEILNLGAGQQPPKPAATTASSATVTAAAVTPVEKSPLPDAKIDAPKITAAKTTEIKTDFSAPVAISRADNIDMQSLLLSSHVLSAQQQIKVGDNGNALHWTSGGLFGSAQQLPLVHGKSLTDTANDYLRKTASLCKGEFAQKVGQLRTAGKLNVLETDITCLDGQNAVAAAVLFVGNRSMFSVISQEGTIDQLPDAMLKRDAIISAAQGQHREGQDTKHF